MDTIYNVLLFLHIIGFVFMSIPMFNLIVVNERALMGPSFNYATDRYMENIIKHGASRCFVFQSTVLVTGILLLILGPLGIEGLWINWKIYWAKYGILEMNAIGCNSMAIKIWLYP